MGWASGSEIAEEVWGIVRAFVPVRKRKEVAQEIIEVFENEDADAFEDEMLICQDAGYAGADEDLLEDEE
jgi:hypothetical protein